jgi:hypothetical protein
VPLLVMTGDEDEPSIEASVMIKRTAPKAAARDPAESGHGINLEEPALFNQLLDDFLHQVEARSLSLVVEKKGAIGWIVFNQPQKRNAINGAMWRGIPAAMKQFDADAGCALRGIPRRRERGVFRRRRHLGIPEDPRRAAVGLAVRRPARRGAASDPGLAQASLAMIHGFCMGGGLEIALACDLRYCGESAQFAIPAAKLGLAYNVEGHKRLLETSATRAPGRSCSSAALDAARGACDGPRCIEVGADAQARRTVEKRPENPLCENAPLADRQLQDRSSRSTCKAAGQPDHARMDVAIDRARAAPTTRGPARAVMEKRKARSSRANEDQDDPRPRVSAPISGR